MASKLFNYTNQKLNAEKLRELQVFNSSDFCGIISDKSPFTVSGNNVTLVASESNPVTFLGGGVLIEQTNTVSCNLNTNKTLWYLKVELDDSAANIISDELKIIRDNQIINKISFESTNQCSINEGSKITYFIPVSQVSNPSANGYYEYNNNSYSLSQDMSANINKTYYAKVEYNIVSFSLPNSLSSLTYKYFGTTLWINNNTFIIPLYANNNGKIVKCVIVKNKSDFEKLLSLSSYYDLKKYIENNFAWSTAGSEKVGNHLKGTIGKLLVSDDTIYNGSTINSVAPVKVQNLTINQLKVTDKNIDKLLVDNNGKLYVEKNYTVPVSHGGTSSSNRADAKSNLGIYYGTKDPDDSDAVRKKGKTKGDIYFKIIQ